MGEGLSSTHQFTLTTKVKVKSQHLSNGLHSLKIRFIATYSKDDEESWVQHVCLVRLSYSKPKVRWPLTVKRMRRAGCNMSFHLERRAPTAPPPPPRWDTCSHIKENQKCERDQKDVNRKYKVKNGKLYVASTLFARGQNHIPLEMRTTGTEMPKMCCFRDLWFDKCASPQIISENKQILPQYISVRTPPTMYKTIKTRARLWQGRGNMSSLFSLDCCCCCVWDFTFQGAQQRSIAHQSITKIVSPLSYHQ